MAVAGFGHAAPMPAAYSAGVLVKDCKTQVAVVTNGPSGSSLAAMEHELNGAASCLSYISGFRDGVQVGSYQNPHAKICIPKATTNSELVRVYLNYVASHPDVLSKSREISALLAFGTAYRCS